MGLRSSRRRCSRSFPTLRLQDLRSGAMSLSPAPKATSCPSRVCSKLIQMYKTRQQRNVPNSSTQQNVEEALRETGLDSRGRRGPGAGLSLSSSSGEKPRSKTTVGWQHGEQPLALRAAEVAKPVPPCPSLPLPPRSTRCPEPSPRCLLSLAQHNCPGPGHRWATAPCHHHQKRIFRMLSTGNCMFRSCILQRWDLTRFLSEKPQNRSEILGQASRGAAAPTHHSLGACSKDTQPREPAPGSGRTEQKVNVR